MPVGQKIKMYYDPRGQVIRTVNPDLSEQRVVYGVPISLDTPGSFTPTPWETYTYDANDLADEWEGTGDSHVNSSHHYTPKSAEVDALGRTVKTMDRLESSNDTGNNVVMKYAYDIRGNLLEVKDAYDNIVFEHVYDLRTPAKEGESIPPLKTTHINKGTSTIVFDCVGKTVETRDAKGALTLLAYDTMQRPVDVWCRDNSSESVVLRQHVEYGTSAGDNSKGKLWKQYDEAGYQQINTYDFKGNVLEKYRQVILDSEILGTISTWSGTAWTTNPGPCYRVDWANPGSINTALLDTRQYQTNMQYDGLNRIKEITYPEDASSSRKILTPTYSKAGALRKITFDSTDYVKEIAYNAKGQRLLIAYGNHIMTRYVYDENTFRLLRLKTEKYTYSQTGDEHLYEYDSGTTKQDFAYLYDLSGNIVSINDETPESAAGGGDGLEKLFEYDALYRLLNATGRENQPTNMFWDDAYRSDDPRNTESYSQAYTYDLMGNIAELAHTANNSSNNFTREFSYGGNLLNSIAVGGNTYNFYYDTCGNMIQENSERFFEWDYADRMRLFYNQAGGGTEPSVISHYLYDAGGNRVKKLTRVSGGNWESITYIDGLIEYREDNVTNRGSISHVMDDTRRVATVRNGHAFGDSTPDVKYNLDDHLGSSGVLLDTSGTLVSREEYYPFGETSFGSYGKKRYRFCGKEKDEESGLYYYGARYYSPWTCRFVSVDPLAGKYVFQTPYAYADNNPICKMDYNGEGTGDGGGEPTKANAQPADQNQSAGTSVQIHQVKKNETLGGIAKKHGISVDALRIANNLEPKNDNELQIGTRLNIPQVSRQTYTNSSFKFNFEKILSDNSRQVTPFTLGLNTPKSGVSGGFSGQFMRIVMGDEPSSSGSGGPFRKISLGVQSSVKWGPAAVTSTSQLSQSQGPFSYSSKITISTRMYLTNTPLGKNKIVPDAEVFLNFQISHQESDSTINYKIPLGEFGFISFKHSMGNGFLESFKLGLTPNPTPSAYLEIKNYTIK